MDGWKIDGPRLRTLRERASVRVMPLARELGCHHNHYRKLERGTAQPSPELGHALLRILSRELGRRIEFGDIADKVPTRRKTAA